MSEETHSGFEIPKEMRSMAEASFDQARKGCEKFLAGAQATAGSIEERATSKRHVPSGTSSRPSLASHRRSVSISGTVTATLLHERARRARQGRRSLAQGLSARAGRKQ